MRSRCGTRWHRVQSDFNLGQPNQGGRRVRGCPSPVPRNTRKSANSNATRYRCGDVITPGPTVIEYPSLLDFPPPVLRAYPKETVVAEKLEVTHGGGPRVAQDRTHTCDREIDKVRIPRGSHSLSWIDDVRRAKGGVPFRLDPYQTPGTIGTVKEDYSSRCTMPW